MFRTYVCHSVLLLYGLLPRCGNLYLKAPGSGRHKGQMDIKLYIVRDSSPLTTHYSPYYKWKTLKRFHCTGTSVDPIFLGWLILTVHFLFLLLFVVITFPVIPEVSMADTNMYKAKQAYFADIFNTWKQKHSFTNFQPTFSPYFVYET